MINPTNNPEFPALEGLLTWASKRQQALGANLANMDTPGYHSRDYSFDQELQTIEMAATSSRHLTPQEESAPARLYEVDSKEKPNGNNVDLEREMSEITKNGLMYITLVQYLNSEFKTIRTAITEGSKG
jgi:flagellar basal-body rod protein FlgB